MLEYVGGVLCEDIVILVWVGIKNLVINKVEVSFDDGRVFWIFD